MSAGLALLLAVITMGSCMACYHLGRDSMRSEMRDNKDRRRRWQEWEDMDK